MHWRPVLLAAGLILLAAFYARACWEPSIRADQDRKNLGRVTDSLSAITDRRVAALAYREVQRESTLTRTGRELAGARTEVARLKARVPNLGTIVPDSGTAVRDSIIAAQDVVIAQQDSQLTIWKALATERGALLKDALSERDQYRAQRDGWRREASKPSHTVTDIGGGAIAGYGLAEENETAVLVGAAVVVVPRVFEVVGRAVKRIL